MQDEVELQDLVPLLAEEDQPAPLIPNFTEKNKNVVGSVLIMIQVVLFTVNSELMRTVQLHENEERPFLMIWSCHTIMVLLVPVLGIVFRFRTPPLKSFRSSELSVYLSQEFGRGSFGELFQASIVFSILYTSANYFLVVALQNCSVVVNTAIYNCASVVVYVLSVVYLKEAFQHLKAGAVLVSLCGVVLMGCASQQAVPSDSAQKSWTGILASVFGTCLYGCYQVAFKKYSAGSPPLFVALFLGIMGFTHLTVLWMCFPLLHWAGVEPFGLPPGLTFGRLFLMAFIALIVNCCCMLTLLLTSPLFLSVGATLTIPASVIADSLVRPGDALTALHFVSLLFIVLAFSLLLFASSRGQDSHVHAVSASRNDPS